MDLRRCLALVLCGCLLPPAVSADPPADSVLAPARRVLYRYPGNHGFIHDLGFHTPAGWASEFRRHPAGYLIRGRTTGGEVLPPGTYRYSFVLGLRPGSASGLLRQATDVLRIEVWDTTTRERLLFRTFQLADFPGNQKKQTSKSLVISTVGRAGHRFEPRIFWNGLASALVYRIDVEVLEAPSPSELAMKAAVFENQMGTRFLDRGQVVSRRLDGRFDDLGDAAMWTGLYAAAEAWRWRATKLPEARERMEASLWALHEMHRQAASPGAVARYVDDWGIPHPDVSHRDTYVGFFFGIVNALPEVESRRLKKELLRDVEGIATLFLESDLRIASASGAPVDFNPYPTKTLADEGIRELARSPQARANLARVLQSLQVASWAMGKAPPERLTRTIQALRSGDLADLRLQIVPALNALHQLLAHLYAALERSDRTYQRASGRHQQAALPRPQGPYTKLTALVGRVLRNVDQTTDGRGYRTLSDAKFLPTQALHALHIVKVAAEVLPKPNRFDDYYRKNLWEHKALLATVLRWHNLDEQAFAAFYGHTRAATMRNASQHLSFLVLYDLMELEKDPVVRAHYRLLFDDSYGSIQEDFNAMVHVMRARLGLSPDQTGIGLWALAQYPLDRQGRGEAYWRRYSSGMAVRHGGRVRRLTRDPVPINERQRDTFIWQRSSRSMGGDSVEKLYPPIDYLFVYWMARAAGVLAEDKREATLAAASSKR